MAQQNGRQLRAEGQQLALSNAAVEWQAEATELLREFARSGAAFTAEDVVEEMGLPPEPCSRNAIGALIASAARSRLIGWTGRVVNSTRAVRRCGVLREWRGAWAIKK